MPALFRFAGIELEWQMHGHDLTPLLNEPGRAWPHPAMLVYTIGAWGDETANIPNFGALSTPSRGFRVPWYAALRLGRYKYIRTLVPEEPEELYDLIEDPEELANLAIDGQYVRTLVSMREAMLAELRRIDAPFLSNLPPVSTR